MEKKEKAINRIEEWVSVAIFVFILVILSYQVVLRFIFHNSNSWSEELGRYFFVWFTYLSCAYAVVTNAHIKIDAVINLYPKKVRPIVPVIADVIFLAYCILVVVLSVDYCMDVYKTHQISMGAHVVMAYMYMAIPVGHGLMAIRLIQRIVKWIKDPNKGKDLGAGAAAEAEAASYLQEAGALPADEAEGGENA